MAKMQQLLDAASRFGNSEEVLTSAFRKELIAKSIELGTVVRSMERKFGVTIEEFEQRNLLDKLGHNWEIEQDYYEWDRATTELKKLEEILGSL
jgi:transposase